jgi:hypothetical protein
VPALKPKLFSDSETLVKIDSMPGWAQPAFAGMSALNRVQSKVYDCALFSAENMLLCAPTGAGKTNVAMLCLLHEIGALFVGRAGSGKAISGSEGSGRAIFGVAHFGRASSGMLLGHTSCSSRRCAACTLALHAPPLSPPTPPSTR